ncbi:DUF7168 domain-containing protein [Segnochrobactrum spirostomi]|uniref:DUF2786 domain-containing protein n=1 Tax=Segnochrobactrum spirostomi TaxID=2608987 RepID=A0A6A7Y5D4_9HYPH|nr:DUF2786 domain-containing protein [Segnochrobactrum spirostomi]MQT14410.1 DUF2786 domain-containing protein [Segnochrobactrum spirostomi]
MNNLAKLRTRLAALRAMTTDRGCTEAEAMAAAEKAAALMSEHGLTEEDLSAPAYEEYRVRLGSKRTPLDALWTRVADFANCICYLEHRHDGWHCVYFGLDRDVLIAEYVHDVMRRAADAGLALFRKGHVYKRRRTAKTRSHASRAYLEGFVASMRDRLWHGLWRRHSLPIPDDLNELLRQNSARLRAKVEEKGARFQALPKLGRPSGAFCGDAAVAGAKAASAVPIDAPVETSTQAPRALT